METKQTNQNSRLTKRSEQRFALGKLVPLFFFGLVVIIMANGLSAKSDIFISGKWRYRITVDVETPEGIKTGSAVREIRVAKGLKLLPEMGASIDLTGEAVIVDLGKRGILFGLIDGYQATHLVFDAFPFRDAPPLSAEGIRYYTALKNAKAVLEPAKYPTFVRFRSLEDPKTVEEVQSEIKTELNPSHDIPHRVTSVEKTFGEGVTIKQVSIEITQELPKQMIVNFLPWLPEYYNKMFDGRRYNSIDAENKLANRLSSGAFSTGGIKRETRRP